MRDQLPALEKLNIEGADIERYFGSDGTYVFGEGEKIEDVSYDEQQIPQFAFNGKTTLKEVVFPKNLFCVHEASFAGSGLKKADFTNTKLGKIDGRTTFYGCAELESIILPETMEWIASNSFGNNTKLRSFTCLSADPDFITDGFKGMFEGGNAPEGCSLYVPVEGVEAYKTAEAWKIFANVKAIGSKEDPIISFAEAAITKTTTDEAFTNVLTNTDDVEVTYSSSNEEVATVDAQGKVTIVGTGETTIKAVTTETELFNSVEASYTLTVATADGIDEVMSYRMFVVADGIQIEGETAVEVYTINGVLVEKAQVAGQHHITLNQGVYVVKLNDIIYKVIR